MWFGSDFRTPQGNHIHCPMWRSSIRAVDKGIAMFCPKCGTEMPDDSQFCRKCGSALTAAGSNVSTTGAAAAAAAAPQRVNEPAPKPKSHVGLVILLAILALAIWWAASSPSPGAQQLRQGIARNPILPIQRTDTISDGAFSVPATGYYYTRFTLAPGTTQPTVNGRFQAAGGSGNDVEVFIVDEDGFVNFKNGHSVPTFYNSGKVTQSNIEARLPGPGTYYLVFNNRFSLISPKAVTASVKVTYFP